MGTAENYNFFLFSCLSALKKMNEKKQVFNMYKTQKAKEEKVCTFDSFIHTLAII